MAPPTQRHRGICPHLEHNFVTQLPQYSFKQPLLPEPASASRGLKAPAFPPPSPQVGFDLRVSLQGRGPQAEALATTAGTMSRPRVLSSPAVIVSVGSSVLPPDPPALSPPPDFTNTRLYGRSLCFVNRKRLFRTFGGSLSAVCQNPSKNVERRETIRGVHPAPCRHCGLRPFARAGQ